MILYTSCVCKHPFNICKQRVRQFIVNKTKQHVGFSFIYFFFFFRSFHVFLYAPASFADTSICSLICHFYLPNGKIGGGGETYTKRCSPLARLVHSTHHILVVLFLLLLKAQINTIWHYLFSFYFTSLYCCRPVNSHFGRGSELKHMYTYRWHIATEKPQSHPFDSSKSRSNSNAHNSSHTNNTHLSTHSPPSLPHTRIYVKTCALTYTIEWYTNPIAKITISHTSFSSRRVYMYSLCACVFVQPN